jgi:hypothetical protein
MAENKIQVDLRRGVKQISKVTEPQYESRALCACYLSPPDKYESAQHICKEHLGNGYQ